MPAKKLSKAEQEKADADATAAEKAALEQQAAETAAAAATSSNDSLFTHNPTLLVPQHDEADLAAVLHYHFHHLYQPNPPPNLSPPPPQPAAPDTKDTQPPSQPTRGAAKPNAAKGGKPLLKKQASSVAEVVAPVVVQPVVQVVGRAVDHPISVLESRWKVDDECYRAIESGLLRRLVRLLQPAAAAEVSTAITTATPDHRLPVPVLHPAIACGRPREQRTPS